LEADLVQENCSILFYRNGHNNSQKKPSMPEFGKEADIAKARQHLAELIKRFDKQHESYKGPHYNETMTRRDFIDPLFKALGWDIDNEQGFAEAYREVIHEDKIKIGKTTKAPDYSFRLPGGKRLFFVEAKKPGINIRDAHEPAYQLRRYGWNAKLPISIITNFEEFAIYDCTKKPLPNDKSSVARINYFNYADYLDKFDLLYNSFSKTQALKGSFDKSTFKKRSDLPTAFRILMFIALTG